MLSDFAAQLEPSKARSGGMIGVSARMYALRILTYDPIYEMGRAVVYELTPKLSAYLASFRIWMHVVLSPCSCLPII